MSNSLALFTKYGLTNANFTYSEAANAFLSTGYTSQAGNTYFNTIRAAEGILIKEDIGEGYAHTFLNGIKIYSIKDKTLLADKRFRNVRYSKEKLKSEAKKMLLTTLEEASTSAGEKLDTDKALSIIEKLLTRAMNENQQDFIIHQSKKHLSVS